VAGGDPGGEELVSEDRTDRVIDAIDHALDDSSVSGDAMRWTPEPVEEGPTAPRSPLPDYLCDLLDLPRQTVPPVEEEPARSFTCPSCGRTSHNPNDVEGYCGACHGWTGQEAGAPRTRAGGAVDLPASVGPYQYVPPLPPTPEYEAFMGAVRVSWAPLDDEETRARVRELYQRAQVIEEWDEGEGYAGASVLGGLRIGVDAGVEVGQAVIVDTGSGRIVTRLELPNVGPVGDDHGNGDGGGEPG
jgi:hypothetical protein